MDTFEFTLVLQSKDVNYEQLEDSLFRAGCDDATLSTRNEIVYLNFDRQAEDLESAIISAIRQIEETQIKLTVCRVEPSDLVTSAEIARRLNRSRQSIQQIITGNRGDGDFPIPVAGVTAKTMMWSWQEVLQWFISKGKNEYQSDLRNAITIKLINESLNLRKDENQLKNIKRLSELLGNKKGFKELV